MAISSEEAVRAAEGDAHDDAVHVGGVSAAEREERAERGRALRWAVASGAAVVAAALWLREPSLPYLVACAAATAVAAVFVGGWLAWARRASRSLPWSAVVATAVGALFCVVGLSATLALQRLEPGSPTRSAAEEQMAARAPAVAALATALNGEATALEARAGKALAAPRDPAGAFRHLGRLVPPDGEEGVVLYRGGAPVAWAGRVRVHPDTTAGRRFSAPANEFYVALQAAVERGDERAVATSVVHAEPPADRLVRALDGRVARRAGVLGFEVMPLPSTAPQAASADDAAERGRLRFAPAGVPLFVATPRVYQAGEATLRAVEDVRTRGAPLLAVMLACLVGALWRRPSSLARRLGALAVALVVVGVVPLNAFSNASRLFDPSFYFVALGGPFTASVAALGLTSVIVLLALLAVLRAPLPMPSRWVALVVVLGVAGVGPFLLRKLAGGMYPPPAGVSVALWLSWEITVCLAATSVLLAGASAGRAVLGTRRGIPAWVAPALAGLAALLGPPLWAAPGRWPDWYPLLWVAASAALALARRGRGFVLTAAAVAGCGAATLVWGVTARKRVELAERDVAGLSTVDPYARALIERFGAQLAADEAPASRADLLQSYVASDLAAAAYPTALTAWTRDGAIEAELATGAIERRPLDVKLLADSARRAGTSTIVEMPGTPGVELFLAVPHADGRVTTALVAPRTRLIADDPYTALLGLDAPEEVEPPYTLALLETSGRGAGASANAGRSDAGAGRWKREGNELHGDWVVRTPSAQTRAHVEVELRSPDALIQRGTLVVLLDLAVVAALWTLAALGDGGFARWTRRRIRGWGRSYRARLTGVLFGFFILPALAFVAWSYQRLQNDDRQSRELLVRETLRAAAAADVDNRLGDESARLETPLMLFGSSGALRAASDTLLEELAPIGLFVPPAVYRDLVLGDEVTASRREPVGAEGTLFGFRSASGLGGERVVLAAPARADELQLDRRRRDLGVLVLFAAALGALAALGLSGVAARELSRPIGMLRRAALAIARGEREPVPPGEPPAEFEPVFSAFRRMAAELSESQSALEEAQRRTAAVLRNVASGVVAVSGAGEVAIANPRAALLLGCALPAGTPIDCVGSPEIEARVLAFIDAGAGEEEEFDVEHGGRQLHARLTTVGWRAPGSAERPTVVLTVDDVTELARAQRVLAWGEMARQVAHEIKNPLTPIRLGVQHLRRARQNPRVDFDAVLEQNVGRILAEIDRLDEIARAFSRYGTAPAERPPAEPVDVAVVARDVVALERLGHEGGGDEDDDGGDGGHDGGRERGAHEVGASASGISWALETDGRPALALAREDELREVLLNVLENARLAGARSVRVRVTRDGSGDAGGGEGGADGEDGREARVRIAVTDDGEGIPTDALPRVFEPHFSTRTSGSGLGLAISRRIIDGWGGSIEIDSERGVGTTVTIALRPADGGDAAGGVLR